MSAVQGGAAVAVVDYGMGNIRSVLNALEAVGASAQLVSEPKRLADFDRLILPGVGAFAQAIERLNESGMRVALEAFKDSGKPVLGICLGMQLLCARSFEGGEHGGLGWFDAQVVPIPADAGLVVPHMGWNSVRFCREDALLKGVDSGSDFYFVHSFCVQCAHPQDALATASYGLEFAAMIARENVWGAQFHPEKSQHVGLALLDNFVRL